MQQLEFDFDINRCTTGIQKHTVVAEWIWSFFPNCTRWGSKKISAKKLNYLISKVDFEGESTAYMHFLKTKDGRRYIELRFPKLFLDPSKEKK